MKATMKKPKPEQMSSLNLTTALQILQAAGLPDTQFQREDPNTQLQVIIDALCDLSIHDGLTGLMNTAFFHAVLELEIERCQRTGKICGLMVINIDNLEKIAETLGQTAARKGLQAAAALIKRFSRRMDTAARIGQEKFALILPECTPSDGIQAALRIHSDLNPFSFETDQKVHQLTTSIGLAWSNPNMPANSISLLLEADQEMQRANQLGGERICYRNFDATLVSHQERSALTDFQIDKERHGKKE